MRPTTEMHPDTNPKLIDANGATLRVGWDTHGWFTVESVEIHEVDGERVMRGVGDSVNIPPHAADDVIEALSDPPEDAGGGE